MTTSSKAPLSLSTEGGRPLPRGLRNNNPLNIRRTKGTVWKGQCAEQTDPDFVQFEAMKWGIRAAFCILRTYSLRYHANCVVDIVSRWAPPSENDTEQYIRNVCRWTGFAGRERLSEAQWPKLLAAMARQETGAEFQPLYPLTS